MEGIGVGDNWGGKSGIFFSMQKIKVQDNKRIVDLESLGESKSFSKGMKH